MRALEGRLTSIGLVVNAGPASLPGRKTGFD
jgi:hypothetical protein